jgi:HEAT repeat protein
MSAEISFDNYLTSIVNTHQKWQEWYTPTDATGKDSSQVERDRPVFFDFGLMVQTVQAPQELEQDRESDRDRQEQKEKIERLPVLEGICKYAADHVLLVGRPGSGKSTALARLLLQESQKALDDRQAKIPVLVELRYLPSDANESSVIERILAFIGKHDPALAVDEAGIKQLLRQGRLLLLVDGVNELPSDRGRVMVNQFRELYQKTCPMIFTTRELSAGGDLGIAKRLEMQPLSEPQMQQFVMAYLPTQGERLLRQLSGRLREFGQTPLLLWMLCSLFQQSEQIPPNLGMVFRAFTVGYGNQIKQDVTLSKDSRAWWGRLLQYLAFKMTCGENLTELQVAISRRGAEQILVEFLRGKVEFADDCAVRWLEDLLKHHLIQISNDRIEFRHQLIQEYYAAEWLLGLLPSLSDARLQQGYLNYLKWTEPLALMLELVVSEEQAVRVVRLALEVDLRLGARLAGAVKYEFQVKTVGLLLREIEERKIPKLYAIKLLGEAKSDFAVEPLAEFLETEDYKVRKTVVESLGKIGSNKVVETLMIVVLYDEDEDMQWSAAEALGRISSSNKAVEPLIVALNDEDEYMRRMAVEALGRIGINKSVEALIAALNDESYKIRSMAVDYLGRIGIDKAVEPLIAALKVYDIKYDVADVLGRIGSDKAVEPLIVALNDEDEYMRRTAAEALGRIGSDKAVEPLIATLNDENEYMRRTAVKALGDIGTNKAVEFLIVTLRNEDYRVRSIVAEALGRIGIDKAVESLIAALNDENYEVRNRAVEALGRISSDQAVEPLIAALNDENAEMIAVVVVLGTIGSDKASEALGMISSDQALEPLIAALKNEDYTVQRRAAEALGMIGSNKAAETLITALKDKDENIQCNAAKALGMIGSDKVVEPLIVALKDKDKYVQRNAAKALGVIGSGKAVEPLIVVLKDEDEFVRMYPRQALIKIADNDRNLPTLTQQLPHLLTLIPTEASQQALSVITAIQAQCKYYNYDIAQTPLPPEDNPNPTTSNTYIFKAPVGQVVGNLTVQRDNIATQNNQKTAPES